MSEIEKSKVLIIEDEELVARMYLKSLQFAGFEVQTANNGQSGIEAVRSFHPDLILLDVMMPGVDGIVILRQLKKDPVTNSIPVVILTNLSGDNDEKYALENGAAAFWVKSGVKGHEMAEKIVKILDSKKPIEADVNQH